MLHNFFRRSADQKHHVNKKQKLPKAMKYVNFPWPPLDSALSIFNTSSLSLFFNNFLKRNW